MTAPELPPIYAALVDEQGDPLDLHESAEALIDRTAAVIREAFAELRDSPGRTNPATRSGESCSLGRDLNT